MYVISNPLKMQNISIFGPQENYNLLAKYFLNIKDKKQVVYNKDNEYSIIMPYQITFMHLFAFYGLPKLVKQSLANGGTISEDKNNITPLNLSIKMNNKNSTLNIVKFLVSSLPENPFLGNNIRFA